MGTYTHTDTRTLLLGVALAALATGSVQAQTIPPTQAPASADPVTAENDPAATAAAQDDTAAGDIVVTGSRIRGVAPVGSSVIAVGRADFKATSAVSTADLFKDVPQAINIGVNETNRGAQGGAGNITYVNSVNLRGIGPSATLTLLNGHRLPGSGTGGNLSDTSIVPLLALQRVEVVADGASAIYGSDAVAGVVNLILRRDLNGVEMNARNGVADNYTTRQYGIAVGKKWATGQLMLTYEHSYHSALSGLDRDYIRSDQRAFGGPDFRVTTCNPGTITSGGVTYAIPVGGVTQATAGALVPGTSNRCDIGAFTDVIPKITKDGVVATFSQDITSGIRIIGDAFWYKRSFVRNIAATAQTLTVPNTNAFFVRPAGTNPTSQTVNYFFGRELGNSLAYDGGSETYQGTIGVQVDLPRGWKAEVNGSFGRNKDSAFNYGVNAAALTAALASSDPATAFNPYGGGNSAAVSSAIGNFVALAAIGRTRQTQLQAKLDGSLFALPGGDVRLAVGGEYNRVRVANGTYTGRIGSLTGTVFNLGRSFTSAYGELLIPLFGANNAIGGIQKLDIDIAGRYDSYSDVGDTWNPKIGVNYSPVDGLMLRGSYGTSFRAPNLGSLVSSNPSLTVQNFPDPLSATGFTQGYAWTEGNLNLQPETATTWSLGADLTPRALPGFSLTLSYFNVKYEGQISSLLGDLSVLQRAALFGSFITRNPSAEFVQSLTSRLPIRGVALANPGVIVDARPANLGITQTDGIDFSARYRFETNRAGTFQIGANGIYYFTYKVAQLPAAPVLERLGFINYPVEYRVRGNLGWSKDGFAVSTFANYVPSYKNDTINPVQKIKSWTTVDLDLSYTISNTNFPGLDTATFNLNATNLFDRDPPYAALAPSGNQSGGFDVQNSNPLGRLITVGVTLKF